jgi:hypothetical protein
MIAVFFLLAFVTLCTSHENLEFAGNASLGSRSDALLATYKCAYPLPDEASRLFTRVSERYPILISVEFQALPSSESTLTQRLGDFEHTFVIKKQSDLVNALSQWMRYYNPWTAFSKTIERTIHIQISISSELSEEQKTAINRIQATLPVLIETKECGHSDDACEVSAKRIETVNKWSEQKDLTTETLSKIFVSGQLLPQSSPCCLESH